MATTSSATVPRRVRPGGTLYRGREGMWSWVAHRITGVLTFFFLFAHVLDTALVRVSPESYDAVIDTYKNPFVNLMEVGLVGAVLYHALNGLRIIAVDFWARGPRSSGRCCGRSSPSGSCSWCRARTSCSSTPCRPCSAAMSG